MIKNNKKDLKKWIFATVVPVSYTHLNDGSGDSSLSILEEYASEDERFKIISQENKGLSGARTVSYTHLDVYKRQIYNLAAGDYNVDVTYLGDNKYLSSTNAANFTVSKVSDYNTVSYTHLDVYKRQILHLHYLKIWN